MVTRKIWITQDCKVYDVRVSRNVFCEPATPSTLTGCHKTQYDPNASLCLSLKRQNQSEQFTQDDIDKLLQNRMDNSRPGLWTMAVSSPSFHSWSSPVNKVVDTFIKGRPDKITIFLLVTIHALQYWSVVFDQFSLGMFENYFQYYILTRAVERLIFLIAQLIILIAR